MSEAIDTDVVLAKETAANALALAAVQRAAEVEALHDANAAAFAAREAAVAAREAKVAEAELSAQQSASEIENLRAQLRELQEKPPVDSKHAAPAAKQFVTMSLEEMADFRAQLGKLAAARGAAEKLAVELVRELQKPRRAGGGARATASAAGGTAAMEYHIDISEEEHAEILRRRRGLESRGVSARDAQSNGLQSVRADAVAAKELLASIERDDPTGVADALQRGADLDAFSDEETGGGALHCAVRSGSEKAAACLLETMQSRLAKQQHSFDLQLGLLRQRCRKQVDGPDHSGRSPLAQLLQRSSPGVELAVKLLKSKADPLQPDASGATPFHECARSGHLQIIKLLLQETSGAALAAADNKGRSGLHYAAMEGRRETVVLLLQVKANARNADEDGCRPVELATAAGHEEVAALLATAAPGE